jgi:hypothetical protein
VRLCLSTAATNGPIVYHQVTYEHGVPWWNNADRDNSLFIHQTSLAFLSSQSSSGKATGTGEGSDEFCITKYLFHSSKGSLTCRKILWHGSGGFTSPPPEGVLRILMVLKIHYPQPGSKQLTSDPLPSTLTVRPPRTIHTYIGLHTKTHTHIYIYIYIYIYI